MDNTTDLALLGYFVQAVLVCGAIAALLVIARYVVDVAMDFHRAGVARLAAHARHASASAADTRRIA